VKAIDNAVTVTLLVLALAVVGCPSMPHHAGGPDPLADLAAAVEHVEKIAPIAAASCGLAPPEQRPACAEGARVLALAAQEGREVLRVAERCREEQDEECLTLAVERAAELVRVLR
jgi:hypothetical protein